MRNCWKSVQAGFTLIEMSIVVAIIGLIISGGIIAFGPIIQTANVQTTSNNMDQVEQALLNFVIRNNRLPCPADGHQLPSGLQAAQYGREQIDMTVSPYICNMALHDATAAVANAVIPWETLGIDERLSLDGWGNRLSYFPADGNLIPGVDSLVTGVLSSETPTTQSDTTSGCLQRMNTKNYGNWGSGSSCDYAMGIGDTSTAEPAAGGMADPYAGINNVTQVETPVYPYGNYIAVYSINGSLLGTELTTPQPVEAGCPSLPGNGGSDATLVLAETDWQAGTNNGPAYNCAGGRAAYVLISHGQSGYYAWNRGGVQIVQPGSPAPAYTFKKYNNNASANSLSTGNHGFVQGPPVALKNSANFFDDILRWRSPAYIIRNCGPGACGNPRP